MADFDASVVERNIEERNFLAAYLMVKDATIAKAETWEYTGRIVSGIIAEMGAPGSKGEKTLFYRSLLLLIFEDIPGLSRIYGRQVRLLEESRSSFDLLKNLRSLVDASKDKEELKVRIEETFENIKEKIEDTTQDINDGTAQKNMEDFFYVAGEGIKEGLKQFSSLIQNITTQEGKPDSEERNKDEDTIKQDAEPVEDTEEDSHGEKSGEEKHAD